MAHQDGNRLSGRRIAVLVANEGVEEVELVEPMRALEEAGATTVLVAPEPGDVQAFDHLDKAGTHRVGATTGDVSADEFDAVLLPGGVANPDHLRTVPEAVDLVRTTVEAGRPLAVICHGPWTLVEADVVRGRQVTSWPSLATDIRNAGGEWVDREVVVCDRGAGPIISSRKPDDLPAFCRQMVDSFAAAPAAARV